MTHPAYNNDLFENEAYRSKPIAAKAIAELLTAGLSNLPEPPSVHRQLDAVMAGQTHLYDAPRHFVVFTGGANGSGKTRFLTNPLARELSQKGYAPRDMDQFYETVAHLRESGQLLSALPQLQEGNPKERGKAYWEQMTGMFPELSSVVNYRLPLINMDMVGALQDECIEHKRQDPDWLVRNHYYRALEHAPELCEAIADKGYSFVVDSTMSNTGKITQAGKSMAEHGYDVNYAVFFAENAPERVVERAKKTDRKIRHADALKSQTKMPGNFQTMLESAQSIGGFIGLYDTSASDGTYKLCAYAGDVPQLDSLNPSKAISHESAPNRLVTVDWQAYERFRFNPAQINRI